MALLSSFKKLFRDTAAFSPFGWVMKGLNAVGLTKHNAGDLVDSLLNRYTGAGLTAAEMQANEFSASEAEKARVWNEEMYNKYESPSALMAQYKEAGLNPALMYEGAASPQFSTSLSSPSSVSPAAPENVLDMVAMFSKLRSENAILKEQERSLRIDNDIKERTSENTIELSNLAVTEAAKKLRSLDLTIQAQEYDVSTQELRRGIMEAEKLMKEKEGQKLTVQTLYEEWRANFVQTYHREPSSGLREWMVTEIVEAFKNFEAPTTNVILQTPPGVMPNPYSIPRN